MVISWEAKRRSNELMGFPWIFSGWWLTKLPLVGNILLILMVNINGYYMVDDG